MPATTKNSSWPRSTLGLRVSRRRADQCRPPISAFSISAFQLFPLAFLHNDSKITKRRKENLSPGGTCSITFGPSVKWYWVRKKCPTAELTSTCQQSGPPLTTSLQVVLASELNPQKPISCQARTRIVTRLAATLSSRCSRTALTNWSVVSLGAGHSLTADPPTTCSRRRWTRRTFNGKRAWVGQPVVLPDGSSGWIKQAQAGMVYVRTTVTDPLDGAVHESSVVRQIPPPAFHYWLLPSIPVFLQPKGCAPMRITTT